MSQELAHSSLASRYQRILCDCDGVMYLGQTVVPGADTAINTIHDAGIDVRYVTNNASRHPFYIAEKLQRFGIHAEGEDVFTSAMVATDLLSEMVEPNATVLVVGAPFLLETVVVRGFNGVTAADGFEPEMIDAVIQGFSQDIGWRELAAAAHAISAGAQWLATNLDRTIPLERGPAPGNGSLVRAVGSAVGHLPKAAGKPEPVIFHRAAGDAERVLVIGDRLDTDIAGGKAAGYDTALAMTGVATGLKTILAAPSQRPDVILASVAQLTAPAPVTVMREGDRVTAGAAVLDAPADKPGAITLHEWDESSDQGRVDVLRAVADTMWNWYPNEAAPQDIIDSACGKTRAVLASVDF